MNAQTVPVVKDLVLVGGGHTHVAVLRRFGMRPLPGVRLTVISRDVHTPYSGMLPGLIAGHYDFDEVHIDLGPLSRFAGARLYQAAVTGIDPDRRLVLCEGRPRGALRPALDQRGVHAVVPGGAGRRRRGGAGEADRRLRAALGAAVRAGGRGRSAVGDRGGRRGGRRGRADARGAVRPAAPAGGARPAAGHRPVSSVRRLGGYSADAQPRDAAASGTGIARARCAASPGGRGYRGGGRTAHAGRRRLAAGGRDSLGHAGRRGALAGRGGSGRRRTGVRAGGRHTAVALASGHLRGGRRGGGGQSSPREGGRVRGSGRARRWRRISDACCSAARRGRSGPSAGF